MQNTILTVQVSRNDILFGLYRENNCALALAFRRVVYAPFAVFVTRNYLFINAHQFVLPQKAQNFIDDYDAKKRVFPLSFQMEIPAFLLERKKKENA